MCKSPWQTVRRRAEGRCSASSSSAVTDAGGCQSPRCSTCARAARVFVTASPGLSPAGGLGGVLIN
jgi:hypothetical protein